MQSFDRYPPQGTRMGITHVELTLSNRFEPARAVAVRALVDTGASHMIIPVAVARVLGFDPEEAQVSNVTVADGRRIPFR